MHSGWEIKLNGGINDDRQMGEKARREIHYPEIFICIN